MYIFELLTWHTRNSYF